MTDTEIVYGKGGTMFAGREAVDVVRATVLSSALGLLAVGIKPTRGMTWKKALAMCETYTGRTYKRGEYKQAQADLKVWIETMRSTIPTRTS